MPIYEYACGSCEHRFETIQRASEEPLRDCPECGDATLKKLLSAPVFRLKGSGWYETDFKTGDKRNVTDASDGADKGDGEQGAAAKDSKATGPDAQGGKSAASGQEGDGGKTAAKSASGDGKASNGGASKAASGDAGPKPSKPAKQE